MQNTRIVRLCFDNIYKVSVVWAEVLLLLDLWYALVCGAGGYGMLYFELCTILRGKTQADQYLQSKCMWEHYEGHFGRYAYTISVNVAVEEHTYTFKDM